ncbi:NADPH-dependent FMN reductase [Oceanobacillus kapialis]|uniref:NADPH-dependent FMN reductase n=1 Tax=Oceanobacillus kapialis TaxID=481353 RepID=A0ABW5PYQ7_9BACI
MKLVGISGSVVGDKTSQAVHDVLMAAKSFDSSLETELIDLKEYDIEIVRGFPLVSYNQDTWDVVNKITSADALVFGSPIYQASISGVLKNLFDHLPVDAFKSKVTGMVTTGGVEKHFLVSEYQLKPILSYLKGMVPTYSVFVHNDDFNDDNEITNKLVNERITKLSQEMLQLHKAINQNN